MSVIFNASEGELIPVYIKFWLSPDISIDLQRFIVNVGGQVPLLSERQVFAK